jgi:hypothetical protein
MRWKQRWQSRSGRDGGCRQYISLELAEILLRARLPDNFRQDHGAKKKQKKPSSRISPRMISSFLSICSFVIRHPGLLLVLLGVAGEVVFDWPEAHGPLAWARRLSSAVLVVGLVVEFFEAAQSDKEIAALTLQTASAQKQIAEIALEIAKANQAAANAHEHAAQASLELEQVKAKQQPRLLTQAQQNALTAKLTPFKKQNGTVIASPSMPESEWFARVLTSPLKAAGWDMQIVPGTATATVLFPSGILIEYPAGQQGADLSSEACAKLAEFLNELGIQATAMSGLVAPNTVKITISVK